MTEKITEQDKVALDEISRAWNEAMEEIELESETYWNSLTKEQQLQAFCAVSRRIYKGELEDRGSYRWVLYDVFGFGPEAYAPAQLAGYLAIHNAIYDSNYDYRLLTKFAEHLGLETKDAETRAATFLM